MKKHIIRYASFALAILGMVSCSEEVETTSRYKDAQSTPMTFAVNYPGQSRATATSFESNDKIGLYVAESKAPLEIGGNLVNNDAHLRWQQMGSRPYPLLGRRHLQRLRLLPIHTGRKQHDRPAFQRSPRSEYPEDGNCTRRLRGKRPALCHQQGHPGIQLPYQPQLQAHHEQAQDKTGKRRGFRGRHAYYGSGYHPQHGAYCHHRPAGRSGNPLCEGNPKEHHRPSGERLHLLGNHRATAHRKTDAAHRGSDERCKLSLREQVPV